MGRPRKQKPGQEKPPCPGKNCTEHIFAITALDPEKKNKFDVKMEFCPKFSNLSKKYECLYPQLNLDGKIYTPCFILEGDVAHYRENDDKYRANHQEKLQEYLRSKKELFEPKHARKSLTCAVCRLQYVDYREHIHSQSHKAKIKQNIYNEHIKDLINESELQHMMNAHDTESNSTMGLESEHTFKPKKLRKLQKAADKQIAFQQQASIFTSTNQLKNHAEEEQKTVEMAMRSFHVEDYLVL